MVSILTMMCTNPDNTKRQLYVQQLSQLLLKDLCPHQYYTRKATSLEKANGLGLVVTVSCLNGVILVIIIYIIIAH